MKFSVIICTYKRPAAIINLLDSIQKQRLYPNEILVVDGSSDSLTKEAIRSKDYTNLKFYQVDEQDKGLTRQRNYGVSKVGSEIDIVNFLDDDIVLTANYFENLIGTYSLFPDAVGVGGYILNESSWKKKEGIIHNEEFELDGYKRKLGSRNLLRKKFGLLSSEPPGYMPPFSNGFSINFLPPSGNVYPVEFFMGGVASYRRELFKKINFSTFFKGYGLYEDMDFCLRASKVGALYVNTAAQLYHFHEAQGRPNHYKYGRMVIRNGWYVWKVKYQDPGFKATIKWHAIAILLTLVRIGNIITTTKRREAFNESLGRISGWWSLFTNKPKIL